jgi:hypothetical protein
VAHLPRGLKTEGGHPRAQHGRGIEREVPPDNLHVLRPKSWGSHAYQHRQQRPYDLHHRVSFSAIHAMTVPHGRSAQLERSITYVRKVVAPLNKVGLGRMALS